MRRTRCGPAILDAVVVQNEIPNVPHMEIGMLEHVAVAKLKEALLAVTGT